MTVTYISREFGGRDIKENRIKNFSFLFNASLNMIYLFYFIFSTRLNRIKLSYYTFGIKKIGHCMR